MLAKQLYDNPLFHGLSEQQVELFATCATIEEFQAGTVLAHAGQPSIALFFVLEGDVMVEVEDEERLPTMISVLPAGSLMGWSALIPPHRSTSTLSAVTDTLAIRFDGEAMREACEKHPAEGYRVMVNVGSLISRRLADARMKYAQLLNRER